MQPDVLWLPSDWNADIFQRFLTQHRRPWERAVPPLQTIEEALHDDLYAEEVCLPWCGTWADTLSSPWHEALERQSPEEQLYLAVFKWERRKGWDVLFEAFLQQFPPQRTSQGTYQSTGHRLLVLTHPHHGESDIEQDIRRWLQYEQQGRVSWEAFQSTIQVMEARWSPLLLPCLYQSVDAYIMLSRGEGWGRPYAEAMAMGLPTIGTRQSGNLQFMSDGTSCLVDVDPWGEQIAADWSAQAAGHRWAVPLVSSARHCLQQVSDHLRGHQPAPWVSASRSAIFPTFGLQANGDKMLTFLHTIITSHPS